jgi:hypothetical protein
MNEKIERIKTQIEPYRQGILNHRVYAAIDDIEDVRVFMQYHVYAVWDFMSLLKSLQTSLTCTEVPWYPKGSADTRYLINEIVVGEESDLDEDGKRMSHFELYLEAMEQCGADTGGIRVFIQKLQESSSIEEAFQAAGTPDAARNFVRFTFEIIQGRRDHQQSAIFTFGREDLIPGMFFSIVSDLNLKYPEKIAKFSYYLKRHIEVDGDQHSHLALSMTSNLCSQNDGFWDEAEQASITCLQKRIELWDGVYEEIIKHTKRDRSASILS